MCNSPRSFDPLPEFRPEAGGSSQGDVAERPLEGVPEEVLEALLPNPPLPEAVESGEARQVGYTVGLQKMREDYGSS